METNKETKNIESLISRLKAISDDELTKKEKDLICKYLKDYSLILSNNDEN